MLKKDAVKVEMKLKKQPAIKIAGCFSDVLQSIFLLN
jgi:hypothetical protein